MSGCSEPAVEAPAGDSSAVESSAQETETASANDGPEQPAAGDTESTMGAQDLKVGKFTPTTLDNGEASHITVQHVLIAFKGSVPGKRITRTKDDAKKLAEEILAKAKAGADFDALVVKHTDDSPPGIYNMANFNQDSDMSNPNQANMVFPREGMVGAFGNVGFPLKVGEVGLASFDPAESKYGWHIIKRLK